jgi:hypothetical protein
MVFCGVAVGLLVIAGCGQHADARRISSSKAAPMDAEMAQFQAITPSLEEPAESSTTDADEASDASSPAADRSTSRKIIYEATIRLVVEEFSSAEQQIPALVRQHEGYIADANVDSTQGEYRSGSWTVRIPVEKYDAFISAISALGVPETRTQKAQDVTAEYIDLEARIANKKKLEERILQLLADKSGEIKDVIQVETELARVREEIERMEGQLRYLASRVSMTTVTVIAREERNYQPPTAPTFAARVKSAWTNSIDALETFGANLVVVVVYILPWLAILIVLAILFVIAVMLLRRILRRAWRA